MFESRNLLKSRAREARRIERHGREAATRDDTMGSQQSWEDVEPYLDEALEGLNDGERQAVMLRYLRRYSYDQVAAALGVSPAAARQRVHRGLERMRDLLTRRGVVVASAAGLATDMKAYGLTPAPPDLVPNTVEAVGQFSAGLTGTKGAVIMASLKTKAVAAALILGSVGIAAATATVIGRNRQTALTVYVDPAPGDARPPVATGNALAPGGRAVRPAFELIRAASHDASRGTQTVGGFFIGYINKGDWLRYNAVDLGPPSSAGSTFTAFVAVPDKFAGNTIEVRLDGLDGPVLAKLAVSSTGGHGNWRPQSVPTAPHNGGVHDLYFRFSGGGWNFDTFNFAPSARPAVGPIPAVTFNQAHGLETRGGVLCETADGHWARYNGLDFGPGVNAVALTYACDDARAGGAITLRLDRPDSPPVAELPVTGTGSVRRYVTRVIPLDPAVVVGRRDAILSFSGKSKGIANVSRIEFIRQPLSASRPVTSSLKD
jgi:hypothetical protein